MPRAMTTTSRSWFPNNKLMRLVCLLLQLRILAVPAPDGWIMARNLDGKQGLVPEGWVMVKLIYSGAPTAEPPGPIIPEKAPTALHTPSHRITHGKPSAGVAT